jgi:hypothetical protein
MLSELIDGRYKVEQEVGRGIGMPRRRRQLRVRDPQIFLLRPLLARPHRHAPILQTKPVDTSILSSRDRKVEFSTGLVIGAVWSVAMPGHKRQVLENTM